MLYGLGLGDRVVAVSHECDFPADARTKPRATFSRVDSSLPSLAIDGEVRRLLAAGEPLYCVDEPLLASLAPELIVTQAQCDVCAVRYEDVLGAVRNTPEICGAQVIALNPLSLADVLREIGLIAHATGAGEAGDRYCAELAARVATVRARTASLVPDAWPRVALLEWVEPLFLASNWMPELIAWAGGNDGGLGRQGEHSTVIPWEALRAFDPQIILVAPCGFDLTRTIGEAQTLAALPGWADVAAVRDGQVWALDGNAYFNRSGPRLVDSLEMLAGLLHPELPCSSPPVLSPETCQRLSL